MFVFTLTLSSLLSYMCHQLSSKLSHLFSFLYPLQSLNILYVSLPPDGPELLGWIDLTVVK